MFDYEERNLPTLEEYIRLAVRLYDTSDKQVRDIKTFGRDRWTESNEGNCGMDIGWVFECRDADEVCKKAPEQYLYDVGVKSPQDILISKLYLI